MDEAARTWVECGWLDPDSGKEGAGCEDFARTCDGWMAPTTSDRRRRAPTRYSSPAEGWAISHQTGKPSGRPSA